MNSSKYGIAPNGYDEEERRMWTKYSLDPPSYSPK